MVRNSKQNWSEGSTVKVGFLNLIVLRAVPTPGDYAPDAYLLSNTAHTQFYKFVPHNGIEKVTMEEGNEMIAAAAAHANRITADVIAKAAAR